MNKKLFLIIILALVSVSFVTFAKKGIAQEENLSPDSYIVVFQDDLDTPRAHAAQIAREHGLSLAYTYSHALKGFASIIPPARLERIKNDPRVKYVSLDKIVNTLAKPTPPPQPSQTIPTGISRIGQNTTNKGTGIGVAVIDTGIDLTHPDLVVAGNTTCVPRTKW